MLISRDQAPQHRHVLGGIDRQRADDIGATHGDDGESSASRVTTDDVIALQHVAGDLDVEVVLVSPEPRWIAVCFWLTDHVGGNCDRLVLRIGPSLDPNSATVTSAELQRCTAGAEHIRCRSAATCVDGDPAGHGNATAVDNRGHLLYADADQHQVGRDLPPIAELHAVRRGAAYRGAETEFDAVAAMLG